ncbi:unnamed protein product [Closterium sp. NIES-54]
MAGPEERGGRGAGGSREAQAQGPPRDSAMAPMQPSLGPPRDEPRVFGLDKFNGDNFAEWSFKMENIFDHYDLLEVMEGTEKRPENDPEKSPWVRKSAQGNLLLGQALGSSQIRHIKPFQREPEKGPKAWAAIKGVHAPATAAVAVVLERQMAALRIEEDEAVEEGVQKFFHLLTRLEEADLNYSELQKKTKLLALLPESWSRMVRRRGRGAGGGRGRGRGGHGGRGGGAASMKSAGNGSESRDDRFPGQFFFVSTQASAGPEKDEGFEEPAAVGKVTLHSLDYWVIDSGATYSMTPRADLLTELEPSPVKHVTSALGQRAEVKGMGKAMLRVLMGRWWASRTLGERILWDLHEDRDVYNEMWQIPVVPMPKERQVAASISTKGEAVGSGDGANGRPEEIKSKKCNLGGTSKLGEHEESGAAALKQHKGEENPKAAAEEEYGENMWGTIASAAFSNPTSATGECDWLTLHRRMGHVALPILQQLVKNEMVAGIRVKGEPDESALAGAALMVGEDEESDYEECAFAFFSPVEIPGDPATLKEALESSDAEEWKKAMESELKSIEENGTWGLVELPEGRKAITSKWLFKIKSDADGKIERYKSRLVAKGYQQKEKVDYKELFAPVVKPTTLRTLLAGAAIKGWGFDDGSGRVLRLKKALYGLKQSPRQWYLKLRGVLEEIGFTPSTADHSLFMLGEGEQRSFMVVYVDDILIFSPSSDLVNEVMMKLQDKFKCKALGDVNFYLGLHIERDVEKRCMRVHQRKYLEALAANFGKSEGHVATPFPSGFKCVKGPEEESVGEEERRRFHSLVGSLMYAAVNTRPDVAFATGQLARVVQCPNEEQVAAGMRVAKYLGQTPTVGLQYSAAALRRQKGADGVESGRLFLTAFSDASFASEPEDMTSVGGFICCVGGGPTAWESKKQVDQALSSVESEYMAHFRAVREIVWQRRLLAELREEQQGPTPLYCDSQGAIALAKNPVLHGLTKHMRVKWHWTRSMVAAGEVELHYVKTTGQPADMMTKRLVEQQHWKCCKLAGMALN